MGVVATTPPSTLPLSNFRANGRSDLKIFFMDRYPKDEHTGKNLVCKKALPISKKNWKKPVGGMAPPLAIGGLKWFSLMKEVVICDKNLTLKSPLKVNRPSEFIEAP